MKAERFTMPHFDATRQSWVFRGATGAIEVWYKTPGWSSVSGATRYTGGVEIHRHADLTTVQEHEADHKACTILGGPCIHDGSSFAFGVVENALSVFGEESPQVIAAIEELGRDWFDHHFGREGAA